MGSVNRLFTRVIKFPGPLRDCHCVCVHVCVSGRVKDTEGRELGGGAALYRPGGHVNNPKIVSRLL